MSLAEIGGTDWRCRRWTDSLQTGRQRGGEYGSVHRRAVALNCWLGSEEIQGLSDLEAQNEGGEDGDRSSSGPCGKLSDRNGPLLRQRVRQAPGGTAKPGAFFQVAVQHEVTPVGIRV